MKNSNYIQLNRIILDNPIVCKDTEYFSIWVYLLLTATHKEQKKEFNKTVISLKPGQLITGRKKIAQHFNIVESKVQRVLKKLEIEHQIEQQTCNKNRLITIKNWSKYQQVNNKTTTSEQPVNTNNNVIKKIKEIYNLIEGLSVIKKITGERLKHLNARISEHSYEEVLEALEIVKKSDFLKGVNDRNWKCDFDWIMNPNNFIKILEGKYTSTVEQEPKSNAQLYYEQVEREKNNVGN